MKISKIAALVGSLLLAFAIGTARADSDGARPRMTLAEKVHDFGTVREKGGPVSCEFKFVNDGGANLVILEGKADCGCTRPEFPKKPVAPGKEGVIKVTYNPLGAPGGFEKVITVRTNGKPRTIRLKIRGTVLHE